MTADAGRRADDERRQNARDAAERIADHDRVITGPRGGDGGKPQVCGRDAADVAGVQKVRAVAPPLVTERRRAERADQEIHRRTLRRVQARGLRDKNRRGDDRERRDRARRAAGRVRDHGEIISRARLARAGEREVGRGGTADAVAVRKRRAVEEPLPVHRRGTGGGRGEDRAVRRDHSAVRRLNRHHRRSRRGVRHEDKLIHPAAILAGQRARALHVAPLDDLVARADGERAPRPVGLARNKLLLGTVEIETQLVVQLAGNLPPETHRAGTDDGRLEGSRLAVADAAAARGVRAVMRHSGLADPRRRAARRPGEPGGVERGGERDQRVHLEQGVRARDTAREVVHEHGIITALRDGHVGQRERGAGHAAHQRALNQVRAPAQTVRAGPLIAERRSAARRDGEECRRALVHDLRERLCGNAHGQRCELHAIHPRAICAERDAGTLRVTPAQGLRAVREVENPLLPFDLTGNACLLGVVDEEGHAVVVRLAGNFPPEADRARALHGGFKTRRLAVRDVAAARGVEAVERDQGLAEPCGRGADPVQLGRVERLAERHGGRDDEGGVRAQEIAANVRDDDGVAARLRRLHIRQTQRGRARAAQVAVVVQRESVEQPLIGERALPQHAGAEACDRSFIRDQTHGLAGDGGRQRRENNFIEPRAIRAAHGVAVLRVAPAQLVIARGQVEGAELPVRFAGDAELLSIIKVETETIALGLAGNLPPETQHAGAGHGRFEERLAAVRCHARAGGVHEVVRVVRLAAPAGAADGEVHICVVERLGEGAEAEDVHESVVEAGGQRRAVRGEQSARDRRIAQRERGDGTAEDIERAEAGAELRCEIRRHGLAGGEFDDEANAALRRLLVADGKRGVGHGVRLQRGAREREQVGVEAERERDRVLAALCINGDGEAVRLAARERERRHRDVAHRAGLHDVKILAADRERGAARRAVVRTDSVSHDARGLTAAAAREADPRRQIRDRPEAARLGAQRHAARAARVRERRLIQRKQVEARLAGLLDGEGKTGHDQCRRARMARGIRGENVLQRLAAGAEHRRENRDPRICVAHRPRADRTCRHRHRAGLRDGGVQTVRRCDGVGARALRDGIDLRAKREIS